MLQIRGFGVRYGALAALADADLDVPSRTVVGVISPNGAGKSTLIDAVTGFIAGYSGSITLDGTPIDNLSATCRQPAGPQAGLRRTFQQGRAIPELTVGQFITLATPQPLTATELDELLDFFGLPPADEPISSSMSAPVEFSKSPPVLPVDRRLHSSMSRRPVLVTSRAW